MRGSDLIIYFKYFDSWKCFLITHRNCFDDKIHDLLLAHLNLLLQIETYQMTKYYFLE